MASNQETKVACLCDIVGFDSIRQQENAEKLQDEWKPQPKQKKPTKSEKNKATEIGGLRGRIERQYGIKAVFTTGPNGTTSTSVDKLTKDLLARDCENLSNFDGKKSAGATVVPGFYVPMKPNIVQPEKEEEVLEHCPDEEKEKLVGEFHATRADLVEQEALDVVKKYYHDHPEKTALVINGLQILKKPGSSRTCNGRLQSQQETDLIINDYNSQTINMIEVKTTLNQDSLDKVKKQLPEYQRFFSEWFGADVCAKWKIKKMAYFKKMEPGWQICENCKDFILCRNEELYAALENDTEGLPDSDIHECQLKEFQFMARYCLFCMSAKELPTKGNLSKLIKKAMEEAGSVENIKLYCFLTPQQLGTLGSKSHLCLLHFYIELCLLFFLSQSSF